MAKRVSDEIDGVGVFTYDTDLLAEAHKLTRPELIDLARPRKYTGISKFRKADLAIIVADTWTAERDEQRSPLDACEHGTAPQNFCQGCFDTKSAYAAQVDKVRAIRARVVEAAHAEAIEMDECRTIARAFLSTPTGVVLTWDEIQRGYLDAMAERDRIEHNQAVRAQTERDELIAKGRKLGLTAAQLLRDTDDLRATIERAAAEQQRVDTLIEQLDGNPAEPADEPREIDTWLESGMVLVSPRDGERYRFERWVGGTAVLVNQDNGALVRIAQADVTTWQYLPKASAEGIAGAKRRVPWRETFVMHERTSQRYRVLGMDNIVTGKLIISHSACPEHERAVSPDVLQRDYIACDENGNVQPLPRNSLNRRSAPAYAVGDRVRWTEDRRLMFVRSVTPTGAYVAPTMDGPLAAFAASEDLSPASKAARLQVFTAGELYAAPEMPKANVVLNLATLLDDPARRLPTHLVRTDGTHPEVFSFVFASDGAEQIFAETVHYLGGLTQRGPVVLLVLCRGGKHRSVAFGDAIARHFGAPVTHFHKDLVPYGTVSK